MSPTGNVTNWQFSQLPVGDINLHKSMSPTGRDFMSPTGNVTNWQSPILKSIYRPEKNFSRKIKTGKNSRRSNLGGLIKIFFKFSKITLGDRTCGPTLLNLPDRTESLITGVGKFSIISLFETNYSFAFETNALPTAKGVGSIPVLQ